ncbi:exosortase/archaeosortase family protein [Patescibacteria group bacterium]|nr:exosortase/archaeosortase family protein [Patescibacteria group bacterium]
MKQKRIFKLALAALAIMLMVLPFTLSINDILTRTIEGLGWYQWIQDNIVPWEVRLIGVMVRPLKIDFVAYPEGFTANGIYAKLSWNCLGWQSLLLFLVSLPFGFKGGEYTWFSKLEAFLIGILGTFLINLLRITFTVVLLVVSRPLYAIVFHDYLAAIMTIIWLVVFWWFSYSFVLEERE